MLPNSPGRSRAEGVSWADSCPCLKIIKDLKIAVYRKTANVKNMNREMFDLQGV